MAKLTDPCVVYWKHTPEMLDWSQGYIGITGNFDYRMRAHNYEAFQANSQLVLHKAMRKYNNIISDIIFEGTREECLIKENELRPEPFMGWNLAIGGEGGMGVDNMSDEHRKILSDKMLGDKNPMRNPEVAAKVTQARKDNWDYILFNIYDYNTEKLLFKAIQLPEFTGRNNNASSNLTKTANRTRIQYKGIYARRLDDPNQKRVNRKENQDSTSKRYNIIDYNTREIVAKDVTLRQFTNNDNSFSIALRAVARGVRKHHKGLVCIELEE